jgi:hypothetical protein
VERDTLKAKDPVSHEMTQLVQQYAERNGHDG